MELVGISATRAQNVERTGCAALAAVAAFMAFAVFAPAAHAQTFVPAPDPPGLETSVALGVGWIPNLSSRSFSQDNADPSARFAPGAALQILWGYHLVPWLSMGLHVGYSYHTATQLPLAATSGHTDALSLGGYARLHAAPLFGWTRFAPSLTVGVDPGAGIWQVYRRNDTAITTNVSAVALPVTLAAEYAFNRHFAGGITLQGGVWLPINRCATVETTQIVQCPNEPHRSEAYFFAGFSGRWTL